MVVRVAGNGYGAIGKRVADAIARQSDMELVGDGGGGEEEDEPLHGTLVWFCQ